MRLRLRPLLRSSTALSLLLGALIVLAPATGAAGTEQARKFFKQAKEAYSKGDYERAATLLEKAYSEEANLTYQYNRIRALQGAEKYREALDVLKTYEQPMLDAKGFEDIPRIKKQLQEKVGPTDETGNSNGGSATSGGSETSGSSTAGGTTPDPGGTSRDPGGGGGNRGPGLAPLGWTLAGVGVASIGVGTLFGSLALLPSDVRKRARNDNLTKNDTQVVRQHRTATIAFLAVGTGALIGGGIILYNELSGGPKGSASAAGPGPTLRWAPYATPDGMGARLDVRF